MANYELKNGQGSMFKNDKKGNDKAPDYNGTGMIHDKEVKVALWIKESQNGTKYFSMKIEDKEPAQEKEAAKANNNKPNPSTEDELDGLPF